MHGWGADSSADWFPWLKRQLEKRGFEVFVPDMPDTENPRIKEWVSYLGKLIGGADKNTYLIGHSIGGQTIMRYLERLAPNEKIGGSVFVAGWFYLDNLKEEEKPIAKPWLETPINFKKINRACDKFIVFLSDNDPFGALEKNKKIFEEKLGAKVIIEHNKGHLGGDDDFTKLPSVLQAVLDFSNS